MEILIGLVIAYMITGVVLMCCADYFAEDDPDELDNIFKHLEQEDKDDRA